MLAICFEIAVAAINVERNVERRNDTDERPHCTFTHFQISTHTDASTQSVYSLQPEKIAVKQAAAAAAAE